MNSLHLRPAERRAAPGRPRAGRPGQQHRQAGRHEERRRPRRRWRRRPRPAGRPPPAGAGISSASRAAGKAASRPNRAGSPTDAPTTTPTTVPTCQQHEQRGAGEPVGRPATLRVGLGQGERDRLVDHEVAADQPLGPPAGQHVGDGQAERQVPGVEQQPAEDGGDRVDPAASSATARNWEPPAKTNSDIAMTAQAGSPEAMAIAPNERPTNPTATRDGEDVPDERTIQLFARSYSQFIMMNARGVVRQDERTDRWSEHGAKLRRPWPPSRRPAASASGPGCRSPRWPGGPASPSRRCRSSSPGTGNPSVETLWALGRGAGRAVQPAGGSAGAAGPGGPGGEAADPSVTSFTASHAGVSGGPSVRLPLAAIAAALRRERERAGLSLTEVARRAGIAKSTLSQLESGTGNPSVETLWALGVALGVPFSQLVDPPAPQVRVVRAGEGPRITSEHSASSPGPWSPPVRPTPAGTCTWSRRNPAPSGRPSRTSRAASSTSSSPPAGCGPARPRRADRARAGRLHLLPGRPRRTATRRSNPAPGASSSWSTCDLPALAGCPYTAPGVSEVPLRRAGRSRPRSRAPAPRCRAARPVGGQPGDQLARRRGRRRRG